MDSSQDTTGLREIAGKSVSEAMPVLARIFNIPRVDQVPTPGAASAWNDKDWNEWAMSVGLTEIDRTKHNYVNKHPTLPIRVGCSSSPGDTRAMMNLAQDMRKNVRNLYTNLTWALAAAIRNNPDVSSPELYTMLLDPDTQSKLIKQESEFHQSDDASDEDARLFRGLLRKIEEYGSPRRAVLAKVGCAEHLIEPVIMLLNNDGPLPAMLITGLLPFLEDLLQDLRDEEVRAEDERNKEREAREARKVEIAADPDKAKFDSSIAQTKANLASQVSALVTKLEQLTNIAKTLRAVAALNNLPSFPTERVAELRAAEAAARRDADAVATQLTEALEALNPCKARVAELEAEVARLHHDIAAVDTLVTDAASSHDWKTSMSTLVSKLEANLASNDFLALAQGVSTARTVLAEAKKAIDGGNPPKLA